MEPATKHTQSGRTTMMQKHKPLSWAFLRWVVSQIRPQKATLKLRMFVVVGMVIATIALQFALPLMLKYIINALSLSIKGFTTPNVMVLCFGYGLLWIFARFVTEIREILSYRIFANSVKQVSCNFFDHLLNQPMSFHANRDFGSITDELKRSQYTLYKASLGFFLNILPQSIEAFIALAVIWHMYAPDIALVCSAFLFGIAYVSSKSAGLAVQAEQAANDAENEQSNFLFDHLLNIEAIQSFGQERQEEDRFIKILTRTEHARIFAQKQQSRMLLLHGALSGSLLLCITVLTGYRVLLGTYDLSDFMLLNSYIIQFSESMSQLGKHMRNLRECLVDLQGIYEIFQIQPENQEDAQATPLDTASTSIVFKNVTFSYYPDRPILTNISFEVPMGKTVALVGPSGSGKSTIAKLLLRLYDPTLGAIMVGDTRISHLKIASLRNAIGYVPQNPVLFHDSIAHNIAYGKQDASFDEITYAAKLTQIDTVINALPQQYETRLGELGMTISGGERQRIALARALLKNPAIFVFDEATSALDSTTEQTFMHNLHTLCEGKTTLIIAHRLSTIMHADNIVVLDHGRIKEQGTHEELLALNKLYAQLWYKQQGTAK